MKSPIIFGEVLFDVFPDGSRHLGGAPFNVAWHLQALGLSPIFVTRVGKDEDGDCILRSMQDWQMTAEEVQIDLVHPTGTVQVLVDADGEPHFSSKLDLAFDFLERDLIDERANPGDFLYHGTFIGRQLPARTTLFNMIDSGQFHRFVDVNLRPRCWNHELVTRVLPGATWAKMNAQELAMVLEVAVNQPVEEILLHVRGELNTRLNVETIWITSGGGPAYCLENDRIVTQVTPPKPSSWCNSVGAGDAFSAALICGLYKKWSNEELLKRASQFAAYVCGLPGATSTEPEFYRLIEL